MLLVGVIGVLGALAQAVLLVVRQAMLIVVVAVLPVAAAAGGTEVGQQSYHKLTAWIIAFLLFKPVAALAYGIAFLSAAQPGSNPVVGDTEQFQTALVGMILLICTAAVLPALMRVITPAVGAVGSGGSGLGAAGGVLMAGAAVATGGKALAAGKAVGTAGASGALSGTAATAVSPAGGGRGPAAGVAAVVVVRRRRRVRGRVRPPRAGAATPGTGQGRALRRGAPPRRRRVRRARRAPPRGPRPPAVTGLRVTSPETGSTDHPTWEGTRSDHEHEQNLDSGTYSPGTAVRVAVGGGVVSAAPDSAGLLYTGWTKPRSTGLFGMTWGTTLVCGVLLIASMMTFVFAGPRPVSWWWRCRCWWRRRW